jgi:DNA-binding LacI/PurR family transcriptional regulator
MNSGVAEVAAYFDERPCDAVVFANAYDEEIGEVAKRRGLPFVMIFPNTRSEVPNSVMLDNRAIVSNWISHLKSLGHKRIAYLHSSTEFLHHRDADQRLMFFYEEMARFGLTADPDMNFYAGFTKEEGYEAARKLLASGKKFTAVICGDGNASGVYLALRKAGVRIGSDVSVIGVDDSSWAAHMQPPLTTVRIPRSRLAELVVSKLKNAFSGDSPAVSLDPALVGSELVVRSSTGRVG